MVADIDQLLDATRQRIGDRPGRRVDLHPLGPERRHGRRIERGWLAGDGGHLLAAGKLDPAEVTVDRTDPAAQAIVLADELGDETVGWPFIDGIRRGELLDDPVAEQGDAV